MADFWTLFRRGACNIATDWRPPALHNYFLFTLFNSSRGSKAFTPVQLRDSSIILKLAHRLTRSRLNDRHHERVRERPIPYNRERGNPAPLTKTLSTARNTTPTRDLPRDASLRAQEMLESRTRTEKWPSTNRVVREELLVLFKRAEHRLFIFFN